MQIKKLCSATMYMLFLVLFLYGCGSSNKGGGIQGGSALFGGVATVGDTVCVQCHSANTDPLTGQTLVTEYQQNSPHNQTGLGCESCHGGGAQHNGVGPIPFPLAGLTPTQEAQRCATCHDGVQTLTVAGAATTAPPTNAATDFASSLHATGTPSHTTPTSFCIRCHTNEGAVLSNIAGFTGDATVFTAPNTPPVWGNGFTAFNCETCHQHGGGLRVVNGRDANNNLVLWDPAKNRATNQFDLCTSCHNMYNYNQTAVIYSGSTASATKSFAGIGPHTTTGTDWYRRIVSTHREKGMSTLLKIPYANMSSAADSTNTRITGYVLRLTNTTDPYYRGPCYDCHAHEAKTNTGSAAPSTTTTTIHADWAQSPHAASLLTQKYAAAAAAGSTLDSVAQAYTDDTTDTPLTHYNWDDTSTRGACQMCHTATGISNYLITQNTALTGYNPSNNNYSHLIGWTATGGSKRQNEVIYCWACHKDAGTGALRNTTQAIFSFTDSNNNAIVVSDAGKSTACVVCHGGRGSAGAAILNDAARSGRIAGHHAPTAGVLYSAKTHIGFEYPGQSYANPSFFAHDKIGQNTDGPCASCHMGDAANGKASHTFQPVIKDALGNITAITNQALCNTCHTPNTAFAMTPAVLNSESAGYTEATTILKNWVGNVAGFQNYLNLAITSANATNPAVVPVNAYGAFQNSLFNADEPCAYVHNRFYIKRLIFDSIDWMDNGALSGTISFDATAFPNAAAWFGKSGATGVTAFTRP